MPLYIISDKKNSLLYSDNNEASNNKQYINIVNNGPTKLPNRHQIHTKRRKNIWNQHRKSNRKNDKNKIQPLRSYDDNTQKIYSPKQQYFTLAVNIMKVIPDPFLITISCDVEFGTAEMHQKDKKCHNYLFTGQMYGKKRYLLTLMLRAMQTD